MRESWNSPSKGKVKFNDIAKEISDQALRGYGDAYRVIIGTDSSLKGEGAEFVAAIIVHRIGRGGIYYWLRIDHTKKSPEARALRTLRNRIYKEATISLDVAYLLIDELKKSFALLADLEIHVDVGRVGATREIISEVVGMIKGSGFEVKTKPEAFAASSVADRHV